MVLANRVRLLLRIAYKGDLILSYLTWVILMQRPTSVKRSVLENKNEGLGMLSCNSIEGLRLGLGYRD